MNFLYPDFLYCLFALLIPVIIHLFNFRKFKTVFFTNVHFLQQIEDDKRARSKLKNILVLVSRILALTFLVLAFSQPFIPDPNIKYDNRGKVISIYIDNSFSMSARNQEGQLLDIANSKAKQILDSYNQSESFQLLTNSFEGQHQRLYDKNDIYDQLKEIKFSPEPRKISQVLKRQNEALTNVNNKKHIYFLISDFQKTTTDPENFLQPDSNALYYFMPLNSDEVQNIIIDSVWFTAPIIQLNQKSELNIIIKNLSNQSQENIPVQLKINGIQKAMTSVTVNNYASTSIKFSFVNTECGWHEGFVSIKDHPITFDNDYFFSYNVETISPIYSINQTSNDRYINAAFESEPYFKLENVLNSQIDYTSLKNARLIILNNLVEISSGLAQTLKTFLENGGNLLIFPDLKSNIQSYNSFLSSVNMNNITGLNIQEKRADKLNSVSPVLNDVFDKIPENMDLPYVKSHFNFAKTTKSSEEKLLVFDDGEEFISHYRFGNGNVFLSSTALSDEVTNLSHHAIFVPLLFKFAIYNSGKHPELSYEIGNDNSIELEPKEISTNKFIYKIVKSRFEIIPEIQTAGNSIRLLFHDQIKEAGHYKLFSTVDIELLKICSFNFSRMESNPACYSTKELEIQLKKGMKIIHSSDQDFTQTLKKINKENELWKLCVIFVLFFLAIEIYMIRFWKI